MVVIYVITKFFIGNSSRKTAVKGAFTRHWVSSRISFLCHSLLCFLPFPSVLSTVEQQFRHQENDFLACLLVLRVISSVRNNGVLLEVNEQRQSSIIAGGSSNSVHGVCLRIVDYLSPVVFHTFSREIDKKRENGASRFVFSCF